MLSTYFGSMSSRNRSNRTFLKDLAAYDIVDLSAREQTLEELFMHLYGTTNQVEKGGSHE